MGNFFAKQKTLIILRGLPGSGKTYLAKQLTAQNGIVLSTDDYFMENGVYKFNPKKLKEAHLWNQQRAKEAMENGESLIVIDNCNIRKWEAKPYSKAGQLYGYTITFQSVESPWKFHLDELMRRTSHGVPRNIVERMIDQWETDFTLENVLNSRAPWE